MRVYALTKDIENELSNYSSKYQIMYLIGIETGLRISDILQLKRSHFAHKTCVIIEQKTKKVRKIEFSDELFEKCKRHIKMNNLEKDDYIVFSCNSRKDRPLSRQQAYNVIKKVSGTEKTGTHSLRKTYCAEFIERGGTVEELQQTLNHSNIKVTESYLEPIPLNLDTEFDLKPNLNISRAEQIIKVLKEYKYWILVLLLSTFITLFYITLLYYSTSHVLFRNR